MRKNGRLTFFGWFAKITVILVIGFAMTLVCCAAVLTRPSASGDRDYSGILRIPEYDPPLSGLPNPDSEVRGVWIASVLNINFPSAAGLSANELRTELDTIVENCADVGFNAIYFQVRPSADSLCKSKYFPVSEFLTGIQGSELPDDFDPFEYIIKKAHSLDIKVHAWVNPYRVTTGTAEEPQHDINALSLSSPARMNPEWVVAYDDGRLYFNPGIPEVRELIAAGVRELAENYNCDGIVFDDYFYPYPVKDAVFDDAAQYEQYGGGFDSLADWRRDNVNQTVKACYEAVKDVSSYLEFGIAPFGIWQNNDGKNGGSDTNGLSSYRDIYCDTLAWVRGGYVDYVAPQLYWAFSTSVARFDVLSRWWNAQLDGYENVKLLISHGAYRISDWTDSNELAQQIAFARSLKNYRGGIMYGYASIAANERLCWDLLINSYREPLLCEPVVSNGATFEVVSPKNGTYLTGNGTYVIGHSDPALPLLLDGQPISRTRSGLFSAYFSLKNGVNTHVFAHNGTDYEYVINCGVKPASTEKTYAQLSEFKIVSASPALDIANAGGTVINLSVTAPSRSAVSATLNGKTVNLTATIKPPNQGNYMSETYTGSLTIPAGSSGKVTDLGSIVFKAKRGKESDEFTGARVRVIGSGAAIGVRVVKDETELKVAENSWYYDDYTPAMTGMTDNAVSLSNGYYRLRMGGYLTASGCEETEPLNGISTVTGFDCEVGSKFTTMRFTGGIGIPLNGYIEDGRFILTLYNVDTDNIPNIELPPNPFFTAVEGSKSRKANSYYLKFTLKDLKNFYGFEFGYHDTGFTVSFLNPSGNAAGLRPLDGRVIIVDAGHGGIDPGALGPDGRRHEKDMNLDIALSAAEYLSKLGADVILTRNDDSTMSIYPRLELLEATIPDLCVSIHQNSLEYTSDATRVRGVVSLYFADSGYMLADTLGESLSRGLDRLERSVARQRLAMVRNVRFPSALVEVGFITCVEEYEQMLSQKNIEAAGRAIADGIVEFYRAQEKYIPADAAGN